MTISGWKFQNEETNSFPFPLWGPRPEKHSLDVWVDGFSSITTHTSFLEMFEREGVKRKKPFFVLNTYADSEGGVRTPAPNSCLHPHSQGCLPDVSKTELSRGSTCPFKASRKAECSRRRKKEGRPHPTAHPNRKEGHPPATHLSDLPCALICLQVTSRPRVGAED